MTAMTDQQWNNLLTYIEEGRVIPVVGAELMTVRDGEQTLPLNQWLARRLAERFELPLDGTAEDFDLNDVVSLDSRVSKHPRREEFYAAIVQLLRQAKPAPTEALLALASIPAFNVFVSMTFDSLLAQALQQARPACAINEIVYTSHSVADLPVDSVDATHPVIFHLLGRASSAPDYSICDDDLLEFVHALQDRGRQPLRLFDALRKHHLLLLGCGYSDWLARFFLRMVRGVELSQKRRHMEVVADTRSGRDPALALFLSSFSADTRMLPQSAGDFVIELARRWHQAHPQPTQAAEVAAAAARVTSATGATGANAVPPDGVIFISYSSANLAAAERLTEGLREANLEVWFDKSALQAGCEWSAVIRRGIDRCALFLPLISEQSVSQDFGESYFWREWNAAHERAQGMAPDREFIVPIIIDDTRIDHAQILPESFRRKQAFRLSGGQLDDQAAQHLKTLQRNFRRNKLTGP